MRSKTLLITGATGFLGGALQARAADLGPDDSTRYLLMARAQSATAARERIHARLTRFLGAEAAERWIDRCTIIVADLEQPESFEQPILDEVTHVVHAGANTSFIAGERVFNANTHGTLALARRLARAPKLERFLYVGTAMICGENPPRVVHEDAYPSASANHLVDYTASKAAAESVLRSELADMPWVVARPSIVVGHTKLGCIPSGSIFWVFRALDRLGLISVDPTHTGIDIVPVDWVAEALSHLLFAPRLRYRTYHLSAGPGARTNLEQLGRAFALAQGKQYDPTRFTHVPSTELSRQRARIAEVFGKLDGRRMELSLALYLRFCELDVTFDNSRILGEGLPLPLPLPEYAAVCLDQPNDVDIIQQAADEL